MKRVVLLLLLAFVIGFAYSAHVFEQPEEEEGDFEYETEDAFIEDDDVAEALFLENAIKAIQAATAATVNNSTAPTTNATTNSTSVFNATLTIETLREEVKNATHHIKNEIWHHIRHHLKNGNHQLGHPARSLKRVERAKKRGFFTWHDLSSYEKLMNKTKEIRDGLNATDANYNKTLHELREIRHHFYGKYLRSLFREQTKYREYTLKNLNLYGVMVPIVNLTKPDLAKVYEEMEAYWMEIYVKLTPLALELSLAKLINEKKLKGVVLHDGAAAKQTAQKLNFGIMYDLPEFASYIAKENEFKQKLNGKVHNTSTAVFELRMAFASKFITALGNLHKTYLKKPILYVKSSDRAVKSWQYLSTAQLDLEHQDWKSISHTVLDKEQ